MSSSTPPAQQQQQQQQQSKKASGGGGGGKAAESRVGALTRSAMNDAQRAFNTAFQGKINRIQAAQLERFNKIEEPNLKRVGRPNLRYYLGDDIDEFTGNSADVLEARARKITVDALGPFNLMAMDRRLNKEIDAQVQEHIRLQSKVDVERVFGFIGVRQLRLLHLEFCVCAIENIRFDAVGAFDPLSTEQILDQAREKGILRPDSEIPVGQTEEQMLEAEKLREEETLLSLLDDVDDGGLTTPQFVDLIIRALYFSGTCPPKGSDEYQELEQGLRNLFSVVDADGSGLASWDEVVEYLNHIAEQKKAAESGQTQVVHITQSTMVKRGPCRKVWSGAERKHAALWAAQVNTTYDSLVFIMHPVTLEIDSKLSLPTQLSCCLWTHQQRHKQEFTGLIVGDITSHLYFIPCEEAGPQTPPKLPSNVSDCIKISIPRTPTEVLFNHELSVLVITTSDGYVMTYNFWDLYEFNTMAKPKLNQRVSHHEPISAAICIRTKVACGTLMGDLIVSSLIPVSSSSVDHHQQQQQESSESSSTQQEQDNNNNSNNKNHHHQPSSVFTIGHSSKRPGGIKSLHFLPSANLILCGGDSPCPTAWLLSRITQHDPIAVIQDQRPNEKPHEASILSFFSDPVYFPNRFFTIDKWGLIKEWEISLLQCVGTGMLLTPTAKAPYGSSELTAVSDTFDLRKFGRMKHTDHPIHTQGETIVLPPGTPNLAMGCFVFQALDHTLCYEKMHFIPIEEMRVKERARSSSSRIVCCQYHAETDKVVATLGCDMAFWHATDGRVMKIFDRLTHIDISAAYLDTSGQRVAYGTSDGRCYMYTLVGGKPPIEFKKTHESEVVLAYCDSDMCIFASKAGKITSYCLTSSTRDITESVCEINFPELQLNIGCVSIEENQCVVGDQFGRVTLFEMVPSAGKILTVLSHRKTLTGTLPPGAAAAQTAYEGVLAAMDKKKKKKKGKKKNEDGDENNNNEKGDNDNEEEENSNGDDDDDSDDDDDDDKDDDEENEGAGSGDMFAKTTERVEKHFHAQRMWDSNREAWAKREQNEKFVISQFGRSENQGQVQGKVHERLISLFQIGGVNRTKSEKSNVLKLATTVDDNKKVISTTVSRQIARNERNRRREEQEAADAQLRLKDPEGYKRKMKGEKEPHEKELEAIALVSQANSANASDQIAEIKAASDRLVYTIARPSFGEVIALCPILNSPCFGVSNACGDIFLTTYSCVEPANVELIRWSGSAPRSVVKTAGKSNIMSMTCMLHPYHNNTLTLVTGDDMGCMTMWNLEDTMNFFFNPTTEVHQKKRRRSSMGMSLSRTKSTTSNPSLGRRRQSHQQQLSITGIRDIGDYGDNEHFDNYYLDEDDEEEDRVPESLRKNSEAQLVIAASTKYYLEESELWLRAPRPQLLSCIQVTKNGASITSLNAIPERNVAVIATGEGKIHVISLFDVSTRVEAGSLYGTYVPHKRFTVKPPVGFRKLPPNPQLLLLEQQEREEQDEANGNRQSQDNKPAQLADIVLATENNNNMLMNTNKESEEATTNALSRWKKVQESILGKRVTWFHLTDDVIKKAAFEDEVSAMQRQQRDGVGGVGAGTTAALSPSKKNHQLQSSNSNSSPSPVSSKQNINNNNNISQNSAAERFGGHNHNYHHPDDDIQDDISWERTVNELLGKEDANTNNDQHQQQNSSSTTMKNSNSNNNNDHNGSSLFSASNSAIQETSSAFLEKTKNLETRPQYSNSADFEEGGPSHLRQRRNLFESAQLEIKEGNHNNNDMMPTADEINHEDDENDDDNATNKDENNIDLKVTRWEFSDPSSTPKAISKKSIMQQVKQIQTEREEKRVKAERGIGNNGNNNKNGNNASSTDDFFTLTSPPAAGNGGGSTAGGKRGKQKKYVKGLNPFEDAEIQRQENLRKNSSKKKANNNKHFQYNNNNYNEDDHHHGVQDDDDDDENRMIEIDVLRPRLISTEKFAEKLKFELNCAIDDCNRFGVIPASPQSMSRTNNASYTFGSKSTTTSSMITPTKNNNANSDNNLDENNENSSSRSQEEEEKEKRESSFYFLEFMPRPPRLFPPQVNSALTMPCACDVDVPIPPHGSTAEWIRDAVENFKPFSVEGRLISFEDEDENNNNNADSKSKNRRLMRRGSSYGIDTNTSNAPPTTGSRTSAGTPSSSRKNTARKNNVDDDDDDDLLDQTQLRLKLEQREREERRLDELERKKRKQLWGNLETDQINNKPLIFDQIQNPDTVGIPLPKKYQDLFKDDEHYAMMMMASARSNQSSNSGPLSSRRSRPTSPSSTTRGRTKAEKRKQDEEDHQKLVDENNSKNNIVLPGKLMKESNTNKSTKSSFNLSERAMFGIDPTQSKRELALSVRPFGGGVKNIANKKKDHSHHPHEQQQDNNSHHHGNKNGDDVFESTLKQSAPGWPLMPNPLLNPHESKDILLTRKNSPPRTRKEEHRDDDGVETPQRDSIIPSLAEQIEMVLHEDRDYHHSSHLFLQQQHHQQQQQQFPAQVHSRFSVADVRRNHKEQRAADKIKFKPLDHLSSSVPASDFDRQVQPSDQVYGRFNEKMAKTKLWSVGGGSSAGRQEEIQKLKQRNHNNNKNKRANTPNVIHSNNHSSLVQNNTNNITGQQQQRASTPGIVMNSTTTTVNDNNNNEHQQHDISTATAATPSRKLLSHLTPTPMPQQTTLSAHYQTPLVLRHHRHQKSNSKKKDTTTNNHNVDDDNDSSSEDYDRSKDDNNTPVFIVNEKPVFTKEVSTTKRNSPPRGSPMILKLGDIPEKHHQLETQDQSQKISSARRHQQQQQQQNSSSSTSVSKITRGVLAAESEKQRLKILAASSSGSGGHHHHHSQQSSPLMNMKYRKAKLQQVFGNRATCASPVVDETVGSFSLTGIKQQQQKKV